jgi:hypothetical protein
MRKFARANKNKSTETKRPKVSNSEYYNKLMRDAAKESPELQEQRLSAKPLMKVS